MHVAPLKKPADRSTRDNDLAKALNNPAAAAPGGKLRELKLRILPSADVWPETIPGSEAGLMNVVPAEDFAKAAEAAKMTIDNA